MDRQTTWTEDGGLNSLRTPPTAAMYSIAFWLKIAMNVDLRRACRGAVVTGRVGLLLHSMDKQRQETAKKTI